jgi:hypothetical protein
MKNFDKVGCTAVSMTPLCTSQWCQCHRCAVCSRIIFPHKKHKCLGSFMKKFDKVGCKAVSMTPLYMSQQYQRHRWWGMIKIKISLICIYLTLVGHNQPRNEYPWDVMHSFFKVLCSFIKMIRLYVSWYIFNKNHLNVKKVLLKLYIKTDTWPEKPNTFLFSAKMKTQILNKNSSARKRLKRC